MHKELSYRNHHESKEQRAESREQRPDLSSFFSATLRGIALSIRTLSLTDRFWRLFTKRSLFIAVTYKRDSFTVRPQRALCLCWISACHSPPHPQRHLRPHRPSLCRSLLCLVWLSGRSLEWRACSACASGASRSCCNTERWWLLCCDLMREKWSDCSEMGTAAFRCLKNA